MKGTHQSHRKPAHRKAPAHRKPAHHKPAQKQAVEPGSKAQAAQAAENRGYDAYDLVDVGYDVQTGYVDDVPPDLDPVTRGGTERETLAVDPYSRS